MSPSPASREKQDGRARTQRFVLGIWLLSALVFIIGAVVMRDHLLDDTFIHLRYVENLARSGELAYNPGEPSFGTSALTYVLLLGKLGAWSPREALPLLAKWLSVGCHAAVLGLLAWRARGMLRQGALIAALSLSAFALTVALPPSGRWLEDGMETSLALLLAVAAPLAALSFARSDSQKPWVVIASGVLAAAPGCLRIDLLPISLAALGLAIGPSWRKRGALGLALAWCSALLISVLLLYVETGHIVSDSAVAKQMGRVEPMFTLSFLYSMMTVSPVWLFGAAGLAFSLRRPSMMAALGLLPIVAVLSAGTAVGQVIHGARYFLPALAFAWIVFADLLAKKGDAKIERLLVIAAPALSLLHAVVIAKPLYRVIQPAELHLGALSAMNETTLLAAHDIGRLGFHTQARVLDLAALVNGRELARPISPELRPCRAIEALGIPAMLVLTEAQAQAQPLRNEDVIDFRCPGLELRYQRLAEPVMKSWNVASPLVWFAWTRVTDAGGEGVTQGGAPR